MSQRIRALQRLGEEFERAIGPDAAPRRRLSPPRPRRAALRTIGVAVAVVLPVLVVAGALLLLAHGPRVAGVSSSGLGPARGAQGGVVVAQAPDLHPGLPWAVRMVRASGGRACLQVGRLENGVVGALGQDGAYNDDHRFHPVSLDVPPSDPMNCVPLDGHGHAFINVTDFDALASAAGDASTDGLARGAARQRLTCPRLGRVPRRHPPTCPAQDLRQLAYGLLGPEARSVSYRDAAGRLVTQPTSGPNGAYLIVAGRPPRRCLRSSATLQPDCSVAGYSGPQLEAGIVTAVSYRDGHVCRLPSPTPSGFFAERRCPVVGYRPPPFPHVSASQLRTPVTARVVPARRYCTTTGPQIRGCKPVVLRVTFTARVAVTSANSYYEAIVATPARRYRDGSRTGCPGSGQSLQTTTPVRAGQQIRWTVEWGSSPQDCTGNAIHITVAFVANSYLGLNGLGSGRWPSVGRGATVVGRTSVVLP